MASILDKPRQEAGAPGGGSRAGWGWQRTQAIGAVAIPVTFGLLLLRIGGFEPFVLIMSAPVIVGLLVRARFRRTGTVIVGVVALALLLMNAPFLVEELQHPAAGIDYMFPVLVLAGALTVIVASIPAYREITRGVTGSRGPKVVPAGAGVLVLVLGATALVSNTRYESAVAQPGDIKVEARDLEFVAANLQTQAGPVTLHVENTGAALHSFTIDELDVDVFIPAGKAARITLDAEPGTYRFYCKPHAPDMEGSLTVG
ncbi:MAG: cupredoxin domain-containing protein [Actinomycetota bacterium]